MMMFEFIALLIVIIFLFNKLNNKIVDLNDDIIKLRKELSQYRDYANSTALKPPVADKNERVIDSQFDQQSELLFEEAFAASSNTSQPPPIPNNQSNLANEKQTLDAIYASSPTIPNAQSSKRKTATLTSKPIIEPDEQSLPIVTSLFRSIKNWFFGGNLVVRVGVLVLLVGVVLLLRLLSDYIEVSIESKLIAIGVIGLGLAGLGLKLAKNRFAYGISLQGAGLAIAYLTTFFAYSVYQVLPSLPSFTGLGILSAITIGLAVRQNAFPLALLALSGGFFAPILTANDTGSLTTLFSYYLLLNVTIAIMAHYRTWKVLNLFGVLVTFGLAYYWGISGDLSNDIAVQRSSLVLLVVLHLALYLFVVVRYAQQIIAYNHAHENANEAAQIIADKSTLIKPASSLYLFPIDTGLLFSVPLLAFGIFSVLLNDIPNALTITSGILAAVYLGLGWLFVQRSQRYALITEGMLALGFGFLTLVIPLALDAQWIAFGWSVQGLALVWFGRRSLRAWSVLFGLLLQSVSIAILVVNFMFLIEDYTTLALTISAMSFIASMFILRTSNSPLVLNDNLDTAINANTSENLANDTAASYAKSLGISEQAAQQWLVSMQNQNHYQSGAFSVIWHSPIFISFLTLIAVVWALFVLVTDFEQWLAGLEVATTTLIALASLTSLTIYWLINRYRSWQEIRRFSHTLSLIFYTALVLQLPQKFEFYDQWTSSNWTLFIALVIGWLVVGQLWLKTWHKHSDLSRYDSVAWLATGILLLAASVHYGLPKSNGVMTILISVALMLAGLYMAYRTHSSFASNDKYENQGFAFWFDWQKATLNCAKLFLPFILAWIVVTNWTYDGVIWGLPYVPFFNLYDLSLWLSLALGLAIVRFNQSAYLRTNSSQTNPANQQNMLSKPLLITLGLIGFWVISSMLIRTLHAFIGTPLWHYGDGGAWRSEQVQTGLTILWTLIALISTIIASRNLNRTPWFMGIGLLGIVVLKLVIVDLSQTEAIWRVISFIGAGSLILLIGYLAPLPPEESEEINNID